MRGITITSEQMYMVLLTVHERYCSLMCHVSVGACSQEAAHGNNGGCSWQDLSKIVGEEKFEEIRSLGLLSGFMIDGETIRLPSGKTDNKVIKLSAAGNSLLFALKSLLDKEKQSL